MPIFTISSLNGQLSLHRLKINQKSYYNLTNSGFWGRLSVESRPQNPEFRNNPENFHPCIWFAKVIRRQHQLPLARKEYSCIDVYSYSCLHPLSNEGKSMFKSRDSHAVWTWVWTWKYLKWALHYLHDVIYGKRCGQAWSFRLCFCSRKRCVRLWRCDDVMTFESTQPTPFCLEKSSVRKWTKCLAAFSVPIGLE